MPKSNTLQQVEKKYNLHVSLINYLYIYDLIHFSKVVYFEGANAILSIQVVASVTVTYKIYNSNAASQIDADIIYTVMHSCLLNLSRYIELHFPY